jgi:transcriptional regulator of acetoin/glycerol metabolism
MSIIHRIYGCDKYASEKIKGSFMNYNIADTLKIGSAGDVDYSVAREPIADSWRRCLSAGLDPNTPPQLNVVSYTELRQRCQRTEYLRRFVRPELEFVTQQLCSPDYLIALADDDNVIVDEIIDSQFEQSKDGSCMPLGSVWDEAVRGTNAIGTGHYIGGPCLVTAAEHFFKCDGHLFCTSVPLLDSSGQIVATIGATSHVQTNQKHLLSLMQIAAQHIEDLLFLEKHQHDIIIKLHYSRDYLGSKMAGMVALDGEGSILGSNQYARDVVKVLSGQSNRKIEDIFGGQFSHLKALILSGEVVKVRGGCEMGFNADFFCRLEPTLATTVMPRATVAKTQVFLPSDSIYPSQKLASNNPNTRVLKDEVLRHNLQLGKKAARLGLPVMLIGNKGTGKDTIAEELHDQIQPHQNFITFNCSTVTSDSVKSRLIAKIEPKASVASVQASDVDPQHGGTLYLDRIDLLDVNTAPILNVLLNRIIQARDHSLGLNEWLVISSTEINDLNLMTEGPLRDLHYRLAGFSLFLPDLKSRSDFRHLCHNMLASLSSKHSLSNNAIEALENSFKIDDLSDLDWAIRTLVTHHAEGIIRSEGVTRILGHQKGKLVACPRCIGRVTKESQCLKIQQVVRECNGNIALTARRLKLSRNTVYLHLQTPNTK